jgi:hypothetical protein
MSKRKTREQRKPTKEETLARLEQEQKFLKMSPHQLEAYATKMSGVSMKQGKLRNQGKMWKTGGKMKWTPTDEILNSNRRYKNTGKHLGFNR